MSWNYRVTRDTRVLPVYAVREVYYNDDGQPRSWSRDPVDLTGEYVEDIKEDLELIKYAFNLPVIDVTDEDNPYEVTT